MKKILLTLTIAGLAAACAGTKKRGCGTTSANMGAERVLVGEKPQKKVKFRIKEMN